MVSTSWGKQATIVYPPLYPGQASNNLFTMPRPRIPFSGMSRSCGLRSAPPPEHKTNTHAHTGSGVKGSFQVSRCLTLLSQDEGAAVAFFSRLHQNAGVPSSAKMIAMLVRCILVAARAPAAAADDEEEDEEEEKKVDRKGKRKGVEEGGGQRGAKGGNKAGLTLKASDSKVRSFYFSIGCGVS